MTDLMGKSIGRYHILEQLGQGGMATVYKAFDTRLEADVAIKIIRTDMFPPATLERVLKRFEREAKALARLTHPNIVGVIDYGEKNGMPYLVMKYLPGGTLKDQTGKPMHYSKAAQILEPIARALAYAHKQKILYRDVKPSNILITESNEPVLTDFGIAKLLESEETQTLTGTGLGVGTPEYMAPEQGLGKDVDGRADIYAMGVVLYELIIGHKPYYADTPMAVIVKQIHDPLPRPRDFIPDLPYEVEKVLFRVLAKDPENRYQSMEEFYKALISLTEQNIPSNDQGEKVWLVTVNNEICEMGGEETRDEISVSVEKSKQLKQDVTKNRSKVQRNSHYKKQPLWLWLGVVGILVILLFNLLPRISEDGFKSPFHQIETTTLMPRPTPGNGSTRVSEVDGMVQVYVPAGSFEMGANDGDDDEQPAHMVYLDGYWIDQTEVTNEMYAKCLADGECTEPDEDKSNTRYKYYGNPLYKDYPVIYVTWNQAQVYCEWAGRELPTEAQWEKAARGTDGRTYPWGEGISCQHANYRGCDEDTIMTGILESGKSPYGAYDMVGNVWEWVADWYDENYYGKSIASANNPENLEESDKKVVRGGSWGNVRSYLLTTTRSRFYPVSSYDYVGFRCLTIH